MACKTAVKTLRYTCAHTYTNTHTHTKVENWQLDRAGQFVIRVCFTLFSWKFEIFMGYKSRTRLLPALLKSNQPNRTFSLFPFFFFSSSIESVSPTGHTNWVHVKKYTDKEENRFGMEGRDSYAENIFVLYFLTRPSPPPPSSLETDKRDLEIYFTFFLAGFLGHRFTIYSMQPNIHAWTYG